MRIRPMLSRPAKRATVAASPRPAGKGLVLPVPLPMALEQRFMFDGAGLTDAIDASRPAITDTARTAAAAVASATVSAERAAGDAQRSVVLQLDTDALDANAADALLSAQQTVQARVGEFLAQPGAAQVLFQIFDGGASGAPSEAWKAAVSTLQQEAQQGSWTLTVELRSHDALQGARGAFAAQGPQGSPVMYLNADWILAGADTASISAVMLEEVGHAIDARLNPGSDTAGDEGEAFAAVLQGWADADTAKARSLNSSDALRLMIDGQAIDAEAAQFAFVNAYRMVYDLNNSNAIEGNLGETAAEKEQSSHNFNASVSLGAVTINDGSGVRTFSGNDVSATAINIGGTDYYGWISRPIKSNGVVRGFYFWTDVNFTNLALAQADGNADADGTAADNRGFVLVVDQAWFNSQITATGTTRSISNSIDGALGSINVANVGSSSDRVDSALNGLLPTNTGPTAVADNGGPLLEAGG
ncbi:MAG: hypothetical protein ACK44L_08330, partial [Burkholderiales bacterium]